jgi:hypothetical protein
MVVLALADKKRRYVFYLTFGDHWAFLEISQRFVFDLLLALIRSNQVCSQVLKSLKNQKSKDLVNH